MMHLRTARLAMVALTALGMIFTTTAHASSRDNIASDAFASQPVQTLGRPMPGNSGPPLRVLNDVKVTLAKVTTRYDVIAFTFTVENSGPGLAKDVGITRSTVRTNNSGATEYESSSESLGSIAPGARKTLTYVCAQKAGRLPCHSSSVSIYFGPDGTFGSDVDLSNNQATGLAASAVKS
jgi:hypothetical protein